MNIFLDFTQDGPYSFKNHYDNLIIVKKINETNPDIVVFTGDFFSKDIKIKEKVLECWGLFKFKYLHLKINVIYYIKE